MSTRLVVHLVLSPAVAFLLGAGVGRVTAPSPQPPKPLPTNEQLTIAAGTLVHALEATNHTLSQPPDYVGCHLTPAKGTACDFSITEIDETSAVWELTMNKANQPILVKKLKGVPAPPPA